MRFWYAAMAPALGPDAARSAALLWAGDSSVVTIVNGSFACIDAKISTVDEAAQAALTGALMQWGQTRPASAAAVVSSQPANVISVVMCEPAEGNPPVVGSVALGTIYTAARAEGRAAGTLQGSGLADTPAAWACAVNARRNGTLGDYEPGTTDPAVLQTIAAVVEYCSGP
jgi:hypothetical protein